MPAFSSARASAASPGAQSNASDHKQEDAPSLPAKEAPPRSQMLLDPSAQGPQSGQSVPIDFPSGQVYAQSSQDPQPEISAGPESSLKGQDNAPDQDMEKRHTPVVPEQDGEKKIAITAGAATFDGAAQLLPLDKCDFITHP